MPLPKSRWPEGNRVYPVTQQFFRRERKEYGVCKSGCLPKVSYPPAPRKTRRADSAKGQAGTVAILALLNGT
jgi:hypothetical protein